MVPDHQRLRNERGRRALNVSLFRSAITGNHGVEEESSVASTCNNLRDGVDAVHYLAVPSSTEVCS